MKHLLRLVGSYKLFSLALAGGIVALGLQLAHVQHWSNLLLGIISIIAALWLLWEMVQDVRFGKYGIDILAVTAIVASVLLGQFWAALVVVLMLSGGQSLEAYAERRSHAELSALLARAPHTAHVVRKGKIVEVPANQVHAGDRLLIKAGELVPADAEIIEGSASFDESSLTGESLPQLKSVGQLLLSGSLNLDGPVTAKATVAAAESQYQQIIKLVKNAAASQAPFVRLADRYSLPFTIMAFAVAIAVWVISGQSIRFLEVIIVATPCPLLLAAPIALVSGMSRANRAGIIVKTGGALERLAETESIAFDKTGTLTRGELRVTKVTAFGAYQADEVLALAASIEQQSNHILGRAIVADAQAKHLKLVKAKQVQDRAGLGLVAQLKGRQIIIGRLSLLQEHGVELPKKAIRSESADHTVTYVAVDGSLAAMIAFQDELRPETKPTLERLEALGMRHISMVTGDHQQTAEAIAKMVGISEVRAEALPADKLHILADTKYRPLAFVGDGVNDAPIMTAADVGIALGARGSTAASESADMVIMLDDLSRVAVAYQIAKRTFAIARQSIMIGIGLSMALMAVFATGKFPPLAGAVLQEVVDVVVIFNALRAHTITT